jgi:hypothetical protein
MKKKISVALSVIALCSLCLIVNVGTAMAGTGGNITEYFSQNALTIDGKWTTADEWHDTTVQRISPNAVFEYKLMYEAEYMMNWLVEFADKTNDAGDRWQICVDGSNDGGAAPNANDLKFEIEGHTTLKQYVGTGTGWGAPTTATGVTWKDSLVTSSPHDPATHYVLEFQFIKTQYDWGVNPPPNGLRIAMYDASNPSQGWVSWPTTSTDPNPAGWGSIADYAMEAAPEGLTVGLMLAVSSVAVVVSARYFRKQPKIKSYN